MKKLLETDSRSVEGPISSQHPGCANLMGSISRLSREKVMYRDEDTPRAGKRPV